MCALRPTHLREAIAGANKFAPHRHPRIFGCALLAAYTVAPRHSTPRCLTVSIWRYKCSLRPTHLREAIAGANKFALRRLLRIFGCALLAAYTVAPRHSTPRCLTYLIWRYKCALQHTHLREAIAGANKFALRRLLCIFVCAVLAAYTVAPRHSTPRCLTYLIWRYKCALQHTHLREAIAGANKFALRRLLTSVTSFFISPNGAANIFALLSASSYI